MKIVEICLVQFIWIRIRIISSSIFLSIMSWEIFVTSFFIKEIGEKYSASISKARQKMNFQPEQNILKTDI